MGLDDVDAEFELIGASLLPVEHLAHQIADGRATCDISSDESPLSLHIQLGETYPISDDVHIEIKSQGHGREEAERWRAWVAVKMRAWNADEE